MLSLYPNSTLGTVENRTGMVWTFDPWRDPTHVFNIRDPVLGRS